VSTPEDEVEPPRKKKPLPIWQEILLLLVTAFVLAMVVKTFFLQAFYIPSGSMEPTLQVDDKILVQKVSYWNGDIHRGDIVVFDDPGGWLSRGQETVPSNVVQRALEVVGLYPSGGHLVKRVIALEGDTVACCDDGRVVVNGVPLDESYLPGRTQNQGSYEYVVPKDRLWVLGDNRGNSEDSHAHTGDPGGGFVPTEDVVGKVWAVVWPADRMQLLDRPDVYDDTSLDSTSGG
jgi:signal peptidase I